MENFFLSLMVGVLYRTNIYVNLNNYNYIKVEPLIPFMISLGLSHNMLFVRKTSTCFVHKISVH
jgi:hypothetical protein